MKFSSCAVFAEFVYLFSNQALNSNDRLLHRLLKESSQCAAESITLAYNSSRLALWRLDSCTTCRKTVDLLLVFVTDGTITTIQDYFSHSLTTLIPIAAIDRNISLLLASGSMMLFAFRYTLSCCVNSSTRCSPSL